MSSESSDEFSEIRGALGSIGLSAAIVFAGSILSQAMGFGTRVAMTRFLPVDGYGEIILGITVLNILGIVSVLGLGQALTRYLPRAETEEEHSRIAAAIYQIGIGLSVVWAITGFLGADFIAGTIFDNPGMTNVIQIFALTLPFYVLMRLSLKGIQGHKQTTPNIVTKQLVRPGAQLVAVAVLSLAGFGVLGLAIGYNIGFVLAGVVGFIFFIRAGRYRVRSLVVLSNKEQYRELLKFSLPLAVTGSFAIIIQNTDRFLLGVFKSSTAVGVYDITFLLSQIILFFTPALNYLFQPIMSEYDAEGDNQRMNLLYTIITRWVVFLSLPIFTLLVLFPEILLGTIFGSDYQAGGVALMILAIGIFASRLVGFSGSFLIAIGDTKVVMYVSATTAISNFVLNIGLIPLYGVAGAAVATAGAKIFNNSIQSIYIYKNTGIHPFTRELVLPTALITLLLTVIGIALHKIELSVMGAFLITGVVTISMVLIIFATRSIYAVELKLIDSLLHKIGIKTNLQNKLSFFTKVNK
jgi:O-antigen/teichoic acid export membrane protein